MNNPLAKKIIIIGSVVLAIVLGAVILSVTIGNKTIPAIESPNGVFYERLDSEGNVIYSITNEEIYEQIKANNGIQQLLMMVDASLLEEYFDDITETEIEDKLNQLTYGTSDPDEIAEISEEDRLTSEENFARSMLLSGYTGNEDAYASLIIAREKYAFDSIKESLTDVEVANGFVNKYFDDMKAITIRFTSLEDAKAVLKQYKLVELYGNTLAQYKGFTYTLETLLDDDDNIVEAYKTVDTFFVDTDGNFRDSDDRVVYTLQDDSTFKDDQDNVYTLDNDGNILDDANEIVVPIEHIFTSLEAAETYKENNTFYYTMNKVDPFDEDEDILVKDSSDQVVYTVKADGTVLDATSQDVTDSHELIFNKNFKPQDEVSVFTPNTTNELTEEEILNYYILMYNYVYGEYRDLLPEDADKETLAGLDNDYLSYNFDEVNAKSSALATYLFKTISQMNAKTYSSKAQLISQSSTNYYYMTFKLDEPEKDDLGKTVLDLIESSIVIPLTISESIELPTEAAYDGTITWVSSNKEVVANDGTVTAPAVDTKVGLSYTIKVLGETRVGNVTVNVVTEGENSKVPDVTINFPELIDLIDNDIYQEVLDILANEKVYGSSGSTNITNALATMRSDLGFTIYDYYLAMDYKEFDRNFEQDNNGSKRVIASLDKTLTSEVELEFTADDLMTYALEKNAAVYTLYSSQFKELLYSSFYEEAFGTQRNIQKNDTLRMDEVRNALTNSKSYYVYMKNLYSQYGMEYPYSSFLDYAYSQYGTKTEDQLLSFFVTTELRPYLINSIIDEYEVVEALQSIVDDNFENYFSLNVVQLLIFVDFDEDGSSDDYNEYFDSLPSEDKTAFTSLLAALEIDINDFEGDYEDLVSEYQKATRDDETWGVYKQAGIFMMTQDLNTVDEDDQEVTHSLTYSGEYGVKDTYVPEFTDALISLYQEYRLPENEDLAELESDLVVTQFGLHLILVTPGDDFDKFSCYYPSDSEDANLFDEASYNDSDKPTLEQLELYATYKFYSLVYDLTNADVEEKYDIVVPKIPTSVTKALDFYFDELLDQVYVLGTSNIKTADLMSSGNFLSNDYINTTNDELMADLANVEQAYYEAILGKYFE